MTTICEKLKMLREESGLKQKQIADYLGATQTFISKVEAGKRSLTVDQLESITSLYGRNISAFTDMEQKFHPIRFAFKARDASLDDLRIIADIGQIAINSRFMAKMLERSDVGQARP